MKISLLKPVTENKINFSYPNLLSVPEKSGCYALTTNDGEILYIGQSNNIYRRLVEHFHDDEKRSRTPWGVVYWAYYKLCSPIDRDSLERGWLNEVGVLPFFNKKGGNI